MMSQDDVLTLESILEGLHKLHETPEISKHPVVAERLWQAINHVRSALPSDHPLHPNQDQDDLPDLGDPRT